MLRIVVLLLISFLMCGCDIESNLSGDLPKYSLNKAAHESTYDIASITHDPRGISAPPLPDTGWTQESIDAWEADEIVGLDKQLADGLIDEARHAELVAQVHADAQHERDRLLNVDYHIYSGIANPADGGITNLRGWEVDIVYGRSMSEDDFQITISGKWEIEGFSSKQRDDGNFDVYFFISSKSRRGIIDWKGLVQSIALDGNVP